jgi:hypothetical protein
VVPFLLWSYRSLDPPNLNKSQKLLVDPFELRNIILSFYFAWLEPHLSSKEMKAARKRTPKRSQLLEAAFDAALVIVIGYALILLSQFQALF